MDWNTLEKRLMTIGRYIWRILAGLLILYIVYGTLYLTLDIFQRRFDLFK